MKEIKFGPNTDDHDYNFKNNAIRFKTTNKVKFIVDLKVDKWLIKNLVMTFWSVSQRIWRYNEIDSKPSSENLLTMVVSPKKEIDRIIEKLESVDTEPMENEEIIDE